MLKKFAKDPEAVLDYSIDWSAWLAGDTIASSAWTIPSGITQANPPPSNTATITTVWLSSGQLQQEYKITNRVTTVQGRTDDRSFILMIEDS